MKRQFRRSPAIGFWLLATGYWLLVPTACGYRTYIAPVPSAIHRGEPLPAALAVKITAVDKKALSSLSPVSAKTFFDDYFRRTNLFSEIKSEFPADVELFIEVVDFTTVMRDSAALLSQESVIEAHLTVNYKSFSKFYPNLSLSGTATGYGLAETFENLQISHYQRATSDALKKVADTIYGEISPILLSQEKTIRSLKAGGQSRFERDTIEPKEPSQDEEDEWEEIQPVQVKKP